MNRPPSFYSYVSIAMAVTVLGACGDDTGTAPARDAGSPGTVEAGTPTSAIDADTSEAGAAPSANGIVVLSSDYATAGVSVLDQEGNLLPGKDNCFNSSSGPQGISMTLSGDVALPTQTTVGDAVVIIDRANSVLTWLDPPSCTPLRQLAVGTGFGSNPHDIVALSPSKAYVTRYGENAAATPTPADFDDGNDLLIVDPSQPKIVGRIDLVPFAPEGTLPRADRAMLIDGRVYVSLNAISSNWKTYGTGRVVVLDPVADQVVGTIDLPGVRNCGAMTYVPAEKKLLVACIGDYGAGEQQYTGSAIVAIDLSTTPPTVASQLNAANIGTRSFSNSTLAAFDTNRILAVISGTISNSQTDRLWQVSVNGVPAAKVFDSAEGISIGALLLDPAKNRVFVADGTDKSVGLVRVFDLVGAKLVAGKTIQANPSHNLPPVALAWY